MISPRYAPVETPLGRGFYAYTERGVALIHIGSERAFLSEAQVQLGARPVRHDPPKAFAARVARSLAAGDGSVVDWEQIPAFQRRVLQGCARIPRGTVMTYGDLARSIGAPRAARAVGTALARNPVPFTVPCHRVVRAGGDVGNYGIGGPRNKEKLLRSEGA